VVLGNEKVYVLKEMKILGLIFYFKLNWYYQTKQSKPCGLFQNFSPLKKWLNCQTALFYRRLYYGAKVWLSSALSVTLRLWQA
jgi:hypothetical protein